MEDTAAEIQEWDLKSYWQTLKKRRVTVIVCLVVVVFVTMLATQFQKPVYQAQTKLLHKGANNQADLLTSAIPAFGAFADQRDMATQVEIIQSWPLLTEAARKAGMDVKDGAPIPVKVDGGEKDNIITITATSTNPGIAMKLARSVADVYVNRNLAQNRGSAHAGRLFLETQQGRYKTSLESAQKALRDYEAHTGAVALSTATESQVKSLSDLEAARATTETTRAATAARLSQLRGALARTSPNIVANQSIARNPSIEKLQDQITDLNVQRAGLLKDYAPGSLKVKAVEAQIDQAQSREKNLVGTIFATRDVAVNPVHQTLVGQLTDAEGTALSTQATLEGMDRSIAEQKQGLRALPEEQFRLASLERDVQVAEKTYLALQDRYQGLRIAEESTLANAEVIEPALLPKGPVSPKKKLNLTLSILVGLILGFCVAAAQEALDDSLRTTEDVERELSLPLLGMVNNIEDPLERSLVSAGPLSNAAEAFRMIRSNIKFMAVDRSLRTLMVTSASKGEGKSTTAANLAIALAQDGKKVILVDGDLRRPCVHKQFGLPNTMGLTNAIVSGMALSEVTIDVGVENLEVITAGPIPPNPAELLDSARFARLMEEMRTTHDIVLFDAPPVLGVADASVLGGHIDGTVLVLAAGDVDKKAARRTVQMLQQARAHVLGAVLNKIDTQHGEYYYNYYYYQYHADENANGKGRRKWGKAGAGSRRGGR